MAHGPSQPNQSLIAGVECLLLLSASSEPIGPREMARKLSTDPTRTSRLLGTLASIGLAERNAEGRYSPGAGLHVLAAMSLRGSRLLSAALPVIEELKEATGLPAALGVLWRSQVVYLYHGPAKAPVSAGIAGHDLYPAAESSIGRVLLAQSFGGVELLGEALRRKIRAQGYAVNELGSVAVPVGAPAVAGLSLMCMEKSDLPRLIEQLQIAAIQIVEAM